MKQAILVVAIAVIAVLLACCSAASSRQDPQDRTGEVQVDEEPIVGRFVGHLVWGHELRSFTGCDTGREVWVVNDAGDELVEIYGALAVEPYQPVFVEVRGERVEAPMDGFGAEYAGAIRIAELIRAENEGFGCRRSLQGFAFVALGNEPGWSLEVRPDGLTLTRMGSSADAEFPPADISREDNVVTLHSRNASEVLHAQIVRKRCVDSMSGARYSFAATVDVDGQQYQGCALQGQ